MRTKINRQQQLTKNFTLSVFVGLMKANLMVRIHTIGQLIIQFRALGYSNKMLTFWLSTFFSGMWGRGLVLLLLLGHLCLSANTIMWLFISVTWCNICSLSRWSACTNINNFFRGLLDLYMWAVDQKHKILLEWPYAASHHTLEQQQRSEMKSGGAREV